MYHYLESGLRNVWLKNGYVVKKTSYGDGVAINDVEGLHKAIGKALASRPRLTGAGLRFLRKEMEMSQRALAELVGSTEQNVSLWERRGRIPRASDRLIRLIYLERCDGNVAVINLIKRLNELDATAQEDLKFEQKNEWREAA